MVPADLRLLDVKSLETEDAALMGESVAAEKQVDAWDAPRRARRSPLDDPTTVLAAVEIEKAVRRRMGGPA